VVWRVIIDQVKSTGYRQCDGVSMSQREVLGNHEPSWSDLEPRALSLIKKNMWRMPCDYDHDDLYQEAYVIFMKVSDRYVFDGPAHAMSMFGLCFQNRLTDLASIRTARNELQMISWEDSDGGRPIEEIEDSGTTLTSIAAVIDLIDSAVTLGEKGGRYILDSEGFRETTLSRFIRMTGLTRDQIEILKKKLGALENAS